MENKVCLAYLFSGCLTDKSLTDVLRKIDFKKLTHLSVAFVRFEERDGVWIPILDAKTAAEILLLKAEIERQQANTKILLSVGGAGMDGFCQVSRTAESRETFAKEILHTALTALTSTGNFRAPVCWALPIVSIVKKIIFYCLKRCAGTCVSGF